MLQPVLPFDARLDRRPSLPYSGRTSVSRACSKAAAKTVSSARGEKTRIYLAWLAAHGPASDHMAAEALGWPLSTVNSVRNGIINRPRRQDQPVPIVATGTVTGPYGQANTTWEGTA